MGGKQTLEGIRWSVSVCLESHIMLNFYIYSPLMMLMERSPCSCLDQDLLLVQPRDCKTRGLSFRPEQQPHYCRQGDNMKLQPWEDLTKNNQCRWQSKQKSWSISVKPALVTNCDVISVFSLQIIFFSVFPLIPNSKPASHRVRLLEIWPKTVSKLVNFILSNEFWVSKHPPQLFSASIDTNLKHHFTASKAAEETGFRF